MQVEGAIIVVNPNPPVFPRELEREIMEMSVRTRHQNAGALSLVARRAQIWYGFNLLGLMKVMIAS
jgi:hypothetical protein